MQISDNATKFYIDGRWVEPSTGERLDVVDPATEQPIAQIALGAAADVDAAVAAAARAFETWSQTSVEERLAVLNRCTELLGARSGDLAAAISAG